ncbi:MAG TPA: hypothetical protein VF057_04865 [Thermoanaerobaculia bacterium]
MRKSLMAAAILVLATSCSSSQSTGSDAATLKVVKPAIEIDQISSVPAAARHVTGGVPIQYAMRIGNRSGEALTLKSVSLVSVGSGAYNVSGSTSFGKQIEPDQEQTFEFWMPASISNPTIVGANGPVTLRATVYFKSSAGNFQETIIRQVNAMPGRSNPQ